MTHNKCDNKWTIYTTYFICLINKIINKIWFINYNFNRIKYMVNNHDWNIKYSAKIDNT